MIHKNHWFKLVEDLVLLPDGSKGKYYVIKKASTSVIIPLDKQKVWLVNQYRYPLSKRTWELPMGTSESGYSKLRLAKKELLEEAGMHASKWKYLGQYAWMAGSTNQMAYVYL